MKTDPVRLQALDLLVRVECGESLDALLDQALAAARDGRDAAFLAELVRGTVQWRERYRHVLNAFVTRKLPADPALRQLLYLTLHQLLALDRVPPYAAVHQAGQLCRQRVGARQVGFVNGVLQAVCRRIVPDGQREPGAGPDAAVRQERLQPLFADLDGDPVARAAAWHSLPPWLVAGWRDQYGAEQVEGLCAAANLPTDLCFHVLEPAEPGPAAARLEAEGCPVLVGPEVRTLTAQARLGQAALREILERSPHLIVQDATVQEATGWLLAGQDLVRGGPAWADPALQVLDLCAAPGGKTARLAAGWRGPHPVAAMDNRPQRVALLRDTLNRTGHGEVAVFQADGLRPPLAEGSCAAVLLDGPCSGTGVLRHHPDGRWQLQPQTVTRNGRLLRQLAEKAVDLLAPGGLLMYATCSLEKRENQGVVEALLADRDDLVPAPDDQGRWQRQWLPGQAAGDGFFAARLLKKH